MDVIKCLMRCFELESSVKVNIYKSRCEVIIVVDSLTNRGKVLKS